MKSMFNLARRMSLVGLALAVTVCSPSGLEAQGLMVTGYADFEAWYNNPGGDGDESDFYFDNHHFNLIALGSLYGDLFAAAEVEYEHAGEEIAFEYGYLGYTGLENIRFFAGKFVVPFGRFNRDLHPTWINKLVDRPHGFSDILPQTYSDVGVWVSGGIPTNENVRVVFDVFLVNGLMGSDGAGIRSMRDNDREGRSGGRDKNKAIGGRVGLELPVQGLDVAGSIYTGNYSDDPEHDLTLLLTGADAAFRKEGFEIRGEIVHANQAVVEGDDLTKTGGYVQASYLATPRLEPVVRISTREMPGDSQDRSRFSFGVNIIVSAGATVRLNYHVNTEKSDFETDNDVAVAQFTLSL